MYRVRIEHEGYDQMPFLFDYAHYATDLIEAIMKAKGIAADGKIKFTMEEVEEVSNEN